MSRTGLQTALYLAAGAVAVAACDRGAPDRVEAPPAAAVPLDTAAGDPGIPIRLVGPNDAALVVSVHVNGQGPYDFVLDTGATFTCIDEDIVARLGLPEQPGVGGFGAGISGARRVEVVQIDSFRIGSARAFDMLACALDLSSLRALGTDVQGLVGLNVLKEFRVTLDFEENRLYLTEP